MRSAQNLSAPSRVSRGFFVAPKQLQTGGASILTSRNRNESGSPAVPPRQVSLKIFMEKHEGFMKALKCRECGREYPLTATHVCEFDFGPLEVAYDYDRIKKSLTRAAIQSRAKSMWRYRELLPVANDRTVGLDRKSTRLNSSHL